MNDEIIKSIKGEIEKTLKEAIVRSLKEELDDGPMELMYETLIEIYEKIGIYATMKKYTGSVTISIFPENLFEILTISLHPFIEHFISNKLTEFIKWFDVAMDMEGLFKIYLHEIFDDPCLLKMQNDIYVKMKKYDEENLISVRQVFLQTFGISPLIHNIEITLNLNDL